MFSRLVLSQWPGWPDRNEFLSHRAVLDALPEAMEWEWTLANVEAIGPKSRLVEWWSDQNCRVDGRRFVRVARNVTQFVNGDLNAYETGRPVLTIKAIDSTTYEINGPTDIIDRLSREFGWAQEPSKPN